MLNVQTGVNLTTRLIDLYGTQCSSLPILFKLWGFPKDQIDGDVERVILFEWQ